MALILSIETATPVCSVAIHEKGNLLSKSEVFVKQSHSVILTTLMNQVLEMADKDKKSLDAIAISKGPGSYTGLRIGTSTAKGFCYALDLPLLSVNTLEAMARSVIHFFPDDTLFCPMLDARRMEVYCCVLDSELNILEETQAKIIEENSFQDILKERKVVFFGNGAAKCKAVLQHQSHAIFIEGIHPTAQSIGELAYAKFGKQEFEDVAYFEPYYLKEFIAKQPKKNLIA